MKTSSVRTCLPSRRLRRWLAAFATAAGLSLTGPASAGVSNLPSPADDQLSSATTGPIRFYPLANDPKFAGVTISKVSDGAITISGRALLIPAGYTGSFTYTVAGALSSASAKVDVVSVKPAPLPRNFSGPLFDAGGRIAGYATALVSPFTESGSIRIIAGSGAAGAKLSFTARNPNIIPTRLGSLSVTQDPGNITETFGISLEPPGGSTLTGTLLPRAAVTPKRSINLELASIDSAIPGGGFAVANITSTASARLTGTLPDGTKFAVGATVSENLGFSFFTPRIPGTNLAGQIGGEFTLSSGLPTDLVGELDWSKPAQVSGVKGVHLDGLNTRLVSRGSSYRRATGFFSGPGRLDLLSDLIAGFEANTVTVTAGIPPLPTGSVSSWKANPRTGSFTFSVNPAAGGKPVKGSGVYLQGLQRAWGYVPGLLAGGRVVLSVP